MELQFSPFDLQCCNTLAGISGSEKLDARTRGLAEAILTKLLENLKKDVTRLSLESSGIQLQT